jgi:hypothetical protein
MFVKFRIADRHGLILGNDASKPHYKTSGKNPQVRNTLQWNHRLNWRDLLKCPHIVLAQEHLRTDLDIKLESCRMDTIPILRANLISPIVGFLKQAGASVELGLRQAKLPTLLFDEPNEFIAAHQTYVFIDTMAHREMSPAISSAIHHSRLNVPCSTFISYHS